MSPLLDEAVFRRPLPVMQQPRDGEELLHNVGVVAANLDIEPRRCSAATALLGEVLSKDIASPRASEELVHRFNRLTAPYATATIEAEILSPTRFLLREVLCRFDLDLADEGVEVGEMALPVSSRLEEILGAYTDKPATSSVAAIHDVGKSMVEHEINRISKAGKEWPQHLMDANKWHSVWTFVLALAAGLKGDVSLPAYAMHAKQTGEIYGIEAFLSKLQRRTRDPNANVDAALAMATRTNTRNRHLPLAERWQRIRNNIGWMYGDYDHISARNNPDNIAHEIYGVVMDEIEDRYDFATTATGVVYARKRLGALCLVGA